MIYRLLILLASVFCIASLQSQSLPSPAEYLGYAVGSKLTPHHKVVAYFELIAERSPRAELIPYGESVEGRPLLVAALSSEKNIQNLEAIRKRNLQAAGFEKGEEGIEQIPIVWLGYNIHGNEPVSSEVAMSALFNFVANDSLHWLDSLVVIIDPCINPDGRERYLNGYMQASGKSANMNMDAWEHHEAWPGGRFNHYLFDLNRDWCWQVQPESRQRARLYHRWMPQIYVDYHEMNWRFSYFFSPVPQPVHEVVTPWQRRAQTLLGNNHARHFDAEGWLYFTRETFDLFYPSYGDSWTSYQGAIGMTYEQAGSGQAGTILLRGKGDTLRLRDRFAHHLKTSLSTIETAFNNREELLSQYNRYFDDAQNEINGRYGSYVIKGGQAPGRIRSLLSLLDKNYIQYGQPKRSIAKLKGFRYSSQQLESFKLEEGDIVVPVLQPQGHLVRVLMEPESQLNDTLTYDITAWALPYCFHVDAYAVESPIEIRDYIPEKLKATESPSEDPPYAYIIPWRDMSGARFLAEAWKAGLNLRQAPNALTLNGRQFERGALIVPRALNPGDEFPDQVRKLALRSGAEIIPLSSGMANSGSDLGSSSMKKLKAPRIALINGPAVVPTSFGALWNFFDRTLDYPVNILHSDYLGSTDLTDYDVIVLAAGEYGKVASQLLSYARNGGKLILIDRAIQSLMQNASQEDQPALAQVLDMNMVAPAYGALPGSKPIPGNAYADRARNRLSKSVTGSIYRLSLDEGHPLAYGYGDHCYIMKVNSKPLPLLPSPQWNVGILKEGAHISGFSGRQAQQGLVNSLALGAENYGQGKLIYFSDTPVFRGFWQASMLLLVNAVAY